MMHRSVAVRHAEKARHLIYDDAAPHRGDNDKYDATEYDRHGMSPRSPFRAKPLTIGSRVAMKIVDNSHNTTNRTSVVFWSGGWFTNCSTKNGAVNARPAPVAMVRFPA